MKPRNTTDKSYTRRVNAHVGTVTRKGQITIPVAIRSALGIRERDKVIFRLVDDRVELDSLPLTLETAYGSIRPLRAPEDFQALKREVHQARAEKFADQAA